MSDGYPVPPQKWPPITVTQANEIAAMTDPKLRNLRITQGYHDLKIALTRLFGAKNVTWCAYATWASKTAGRFIRGEEVPRFVREYLDRAEHVGAGLSSANAALSAVHPDAGIHPSLIAEAIEGVLLDVTNHVGEGNLIVFEELAPLYAAMLDAFAAGPATTTAALDAFLANHFTPGPIDQGGQDYLIEAFRAYHAALGEDDAIRKAELVFYGNALVGYHEQIRLQGPIEGALDAPIQDTLIAACTSAHRAKLPALLHAVVDEVVAHLVMPLVTRIEEEVRELATRWLMTSVLPDAVLALGKDVPPLALGKEFPDDLATATYPPLVELLARLDRTPNSLAGSAANDWAALIDRMNFVVDFFRSRQQDPAMYQQPFTDAQVEVIRAGGWPAGSL